VRNWPIVCGPSRLEEWPDEYHHHRRRSPQACRPFWTA
jgi:hypothetical protein